MESINERIADLEKQIKNLTEIVKKLTPLLDKSPVPKTKLGATTLPAEVTPTSIDSGRGSINGGPVIWNSVEATQPPADTEPTLPSDLSNLKSYNDHSHSRYSGGAMIKDITDFVEYDFVATPITNLYCQSRWPKTLKIKTEQNSAGESINKIGPLDIIFDADTGKWGVVAVEIDVRKCNFVMRDANGDLELDSRGVGMSSPLYNTDSTKSSIAWDSNGGCWRLYAAYAPDGSQI